MQNRLKDVSEIANMRVGGKMLATIYDELRAKVVPGSNELELNAWVDREIKALGAHATYKDPDINFPGVICISTNDQIVHGVPRNHELQQGDVVSFDLVITYNGMKTDSAFTMVVGEESTGDKKRLVTATEQSLYAGIEVIKDGVKTGDIGAAIESVLTKARLGIVRELVGHGVGHEMHEAPDIPNYGKSGTGVVLRAGQTIAIEPMAMLGKERIKQESDGWTISTRDGSLAAHFEHTILVTATGYEILTKL